jgi:ABC-type Fe3+-hydroxamate transport system substrate-binding protein
MFDYAHRGLPDILETMRALGERIGMKAGADAARQKFSSSSTPRAPASASLPRRRRCSCSAASRGRFAASTRAAGSGFLHDVLELAGGSDVLGDLRQQSVDLSTEMIITRAPEAIIELHYGDPLPPERLEAERRVWNALAVRSSGKSGRVHLLVGDEFVVPGSRERRRRRSLRPHAAP